MRKYWISLIIGIGLLGAAVYLVSILNPFNETLVQELIDSKIINSIGEFNEYVSEMTQQGLLWDLLNVRNVIILGLVIIGAVTGIFTFFHLIIDRLFVKKFYEQPSLVIAVRRGIFLGIFLVGLVVIKLYAFEWYVFILWGALVLIVELVIWKTFQKVPEPEKGKEQITRFEKFKKQITANFKRRKEELKSETTPS